MDWAALKELRLRAPARHHKWYSSLKAWNKLSKLGLAPSKTHAFRCFQMIQAPNITNVLKPFRLSFWIFLTLFLHHSEKENSCLEGTQSCKPKLDRTRNQKSLVNTQVVSIFWIHKWWVYFESFISKQQWEKVKFSTMYLVSIIWIHVFGKESISNCTIIFFLIGLVQLCFRSSSRAC